MSDGPEDIRCPECAQRLGSTSNRGVAERTIAWHKTHCTAALDLELHSDGEADRG